MLKKLFTSATRVKLLTIFLLNPDGEFFIRELTRELGEQINSIRRELENLESIGLLKAKVKNRKKYYSVNPSFIILEELKAIIGKGMSNQDEITRKITEFGKVHLLLLTGLFVQKESVIDLFIVGEINKEKLEYYLNNEIDTTRPIRFSVMSKDEYIYRQKCKDKFITDLLAESGNILAINNLLN